MPKTIVILFDGTSNQIAADRTNVLRLYGTLRKDPGQVVWYDPGVGTLGSDAGFLQSWHRAAEVFGMATGYGLDANVKEAYRFLVETYDGRGAAPEDRDRICILGFSRGAYTARVLAGFLHVLGLIEPRNLNLLDYAYRAYKRIGAAAVDEGAAKAFAEVRLYDRVLRPDRPTIRLLGLFDTVASVIESSGRGLRLRAHAHTAVNPSVEAVRHAVAIAERRTMFQPQLWATGQHVRLRRPGGVVAQDVREVWFSGVHCDVGGGYPEAESQLAKIPLAWLIRETRGLGLSYVDGVVDDLVLGTDLSKHYVAPDAHAPQHDSMTRAWPLIEILPRRRPAASRRRALWGMTVPLFEHRRIPEGARIHRSVVERSAACGRSPPNLPSRYEIED